MKNKILIGCFSVIAILLLIFDTKTAFHGASQGIYQCIYVVIPSLFPFFFISSLLCSVLSGSHIKPLQPIGKILRIPIGSESLFLLGLLGGYPVGAQAISTAWKNGELSTNDAKRMLGFCSNAGPSFIFGMAASLFGTKTVPWLLWLIHIFSAFAVGLVIPGRRSTSAVQKQHVMSLPEALRKSVSITASVCGWIVLFRILIAYFEKWFMSFFSPTVMAVLIGSLELTNGCIGLEGITLPAVRFILCSISLAFGGICVSLQTCSVVGKLGTGMYFPGKCLQSLFSFILSWIATCFLFPGQLNIHWIFPTLLILLSISFLFVFRYKIRRKIWKLCQL